MSLIDQFGPQRKRPGQSDFVKLRRVPIQPADVPFDKIFMGAELGYLSFSGDKPRPSDAVTIVGQPPNQVVLSVGDPVQRDPIFAESCVCKCPQRGVIFAMTPVRGASPILAMDSEGTLLQVIGKPNFLYGRGIAVDSRSPHDLWVLDDRRRLTFATDATESEFQTDYFWLVRFSVSGGQYQYVSQHALTDPTTFLTSMGTRSVVNPAATTEPDPPDFIHNPLSVVEGMVHITLWRPPARLLVFNGSTFTIQNLTLDGDPYDKALRGQIITVPDKPANRSTRYVCGVTATIAGGITTAITAPELIAFNSDYEITDRIDLTDTIAYPAGLASVCNRILILDSSALTITTSDDE
jgi:hypothetical protein